MIIAITMNKRDPYKWFPHDYIFQPLVYITPAFVTPNHVTIFRMVLTPLVILLLLFENYSIGVPLFCFTALTDAFDGSLARIRHQITPWGTFYDPVADKFLIGSVIVLIVVKFVNPIIAAVIIAIEILLILGGWYQRQRGRVVTANIWGKVKMCLEVCAVIFVLIAVWGGADLFIDLSNGTLVLAAIFAVISLLTYSL